MEYITGLPTVGQNADGTLGINKFDQPYFSGITSDQTTPPILIKRHELQLGQYSRANDKLVLLIRDYKECIPRHENKEKYTIRDLKTCDCYWENLSLFDQWKNDNRHMIYYEDLIQKDTLGMVLRHLCHFLGVQYRLNQYADLFTNFEKHRKRCLELYGKSVTKGTTAHHHVKLIDYPQEWDQYAEASGYGKYLFRYIEPVNTRYRKHNRT